MRSNAFPNKCATNRLSIDEVWGRAGGRRAYNRMRQFQANYRLTKVGNLLHQTGFDRGYQTRIATAPGVHRSTVCRDLKRLRRRDLYGPDADKLARGLALSPNTPATTRRLTGSSS